jgi:hypothetical protein
MVNISAVKVRVGGIGVGKEGLTGDIGVGVIKAGNAEGVGKDEMNELGGGICCLDE